MAKILISIDEALLRRIDRAARARGVSRSGFLGELARRELGAVGGAGGSPAARAALRSLDRLFAKARAPEGTTAIVRRERDARTKKLSGS
jgi:hypothetical protein